MRVHSRNYATPGQTGQSQKKSRSPGTCASIRRPLTRSTPRTISQCSRSTPGARPSRCYRSRPSSNKSGAEPWRSPDSWCITLLLASRRRIQKTRISCRTSNSSMPVRSSVWCGPFRAPPSIITSLADDEVRWARRVSGSPLPALRFLDVHLRVGAVGRGLGVADMHRQRHVVEHRAERREAQHHVVRAAAVAHQAEAPDLALERPEAGADLEAELGEQRASHLGFVHALGTHDRVHLRQLILLPDEELEAHRLEPGLEREIMALVARPGVLQAFLVDRKSVV